MSFFSNLLNFFQPVSSENTEVFDFLDKSEGLLTPEKVLEIALPIAVNQGWVMKYSDGTVLENDDPYLVRHKKTGKVFWYVNFLISKVEGEKWTGVDNIIGTIKVDDATGDILGIKGQRG